MNNKSQSKILQQGVTQIATGTFESNFAAKCWACDTRADGREMSSFRDVTFCFDGDAGHCLVTLGKTAVMATVQAGLVAPSQYAPRNGFFEITARVVPVDSKVDPRVLQSFLDRLYKNPSAPVLDVAGLCVVAGRVVWSVQVGVVVLSDAGNVFDAATWACTAALSHFRRDEVAVSGDNVRRFSAHERDPVPLAMLQMPISLTMLILSPLTPSSGTTAATTSTEHDSSLSSSCSSQASTYLCVDPSSVEEQCKTVSVTVGSNADGQTCYFHGVSSPSFTSSSSTSHLTYADVKRARLESKKLAPEVLNLMKLAMKNDEAARKAAALSKFEWAQKRVGVRQRE